jgi:hypothetical protein
MAANTTASAEKAMPNVALRATRIEPITPIRSNGATGDDWNPPVHKRTRHVRLQVAPPNSRQY